MEPISILFVGGVWGVGLVAGSIIDRKRKKKKAQARRELDHRERMLENNSIRLLHPNINGNIRSKPSVYSQSIGKLNGSRGYIAIDGYIVGERHTASGVTSNIWYRFEGGYIWSGLTNSHATYGLRDYGLGYEIADSPKKRQITAADDPDITYDVSSYAKEIEKIVLNSKLTT